MYVRSVDLVRSLTVRIFFLLIRYLEGQSFVGIVRNIKQNLRLEWSHYVFEIHEINDVLM